MFSRKPAERAVRWNSGNLIVKTRSCRDVVSLLEGNTVAYVILYEGSSKIVSLKLNIQIVGEEMMTFEPSVLVAQPQSEIYF